MGVFGQRFAADATPEGPEFRVNEIEDGHQFYPSVAMMNDGGFVAAFHSSPEDGRDFEVWARRFDENGEGTTEFQLNTHTDSLQKLVRIAALPEGFVAVWESYGQDGDGYGVYRRCFDEAVSVDASELMAYDVGDGWQQAPAVAGGSDRYVVAWYENTPDGKFLIKSRVFTAADSEPVPGL